MAWLYWLLAPVVMTMAGVLGLVLRERLSTGAMRNTDPHSEHQQLLDALARAHPPILTPLNVIEPERDAEAAHSGVISTDG